MEEPKSAEQIEQELAEAEAYLVKRMSDTDFKNIIKKHQEEFELEYERVMQAAIEYYNAGLGEPMSLTFWKKWPQEALDYPGGPVAVYEEAIRRGVTWEEVCGYSHLRYGVDYWD